MTDNAQASQHKSMAKSANAKAVKPPRRAGIEAVMNARLSSLLAMAVVSVATLAGQAPQAVDTTKLGPRVGAVVPAFAGVDQFGKPHTLASAYGPKGAMLVFFRSADW